MKGRKRKGKDLMSDDRAKMERDWFMIDTVFYPLTFSFILSSSFFPFSSSHFIPPSYNPPHPLFTSLVPTTWKMNLTNCDDESSLETLSSPIQRKDDKRAGDNDWRRQIFEKRVMRSWRKSKKGGTRLWRDAQKVKSEWNDLPRSSKEWGMGEQVQRRGWLKMWLSELSLSTVVFVSFFSCYPPFTRESVDAQSPRS